VKVSIKDRDIIASMAGSGKVPKTISKQTGVPIEDVKFYITLPKGKKRKGRSKRTNYPRMKYSSWVDWKSYQLRGSIVNRSKKYNIEVPSIDFFRKWLNNCNGNFFCVFTNERINRDDIELDHGIPLSRGGTNKLSNLDFTSKRINRIKGEMTSREFNDLLYLLDTFEDKGKDLLKRLYASSNMFGGSWK